jgi:NodT family efflux transporter outer membrane factor (OMF) lipoprotein
MQAISPTRLSERWPTRSLTLLASFFLGACAIGPDFEPPGVPWLDTWSSDSLQSLEEEARLQDRALLDEWWRNFDDPVLEEMVEQALGLNLGVRTAGMRILEARAQLGIAGSGLYPQLQQVDAEGLRIGTESNEARSREFWFAAVGLNVGWEMDFWGKFRRGIEAADAEYLASIAEYDDLQVLVAAEAASLYATIRTTELRLRIARENAALQERSLEITERLFRSGNESELDLQQARTLYLSTLATIPEIEGVLRQAENALGVLLARPPGPLPEMEAGREKIPEAELGVIAELPSELLRRRPDVRAAELQLAAQSARIGVSETELYPSIALVGTVALSASSLAPEPHTLDYGIGPTLVWNIFDWGRLENQVLVQDARFQQLYEQYQDTVLQAARELDDAAIGFAQRRAQVEILAEAVQAARRSLDIADVQYREGLVDFQRVLDTQRSLFTQQERLASTQGDVVQSLIALYKALGGGWQTGRTRSLVDDATRDTMAERSNWKRLLEAPLPPAEDSEPPPQTKAP